MIVNRAFIILTTLLIQFKWIVSQPADLSTFGKQNDVQAGFASYSFSSDDRMPPELYVLAYLNYTYRKSDGSEGRYAEESAKYGEGPRKKVSGRVIHVTSANDTNDHTACSEFLTDTKGRPLPKNQPWIALIKRGVCKFDEKVKHVYDYHAIGAIVYNHLDAPNLDKMKIEDKNRNITAVFTKKSVGEDIAKYAEEQNITISISEGRYGKPIPNINRTSVLFVSISFIVLMIISFVWLIFYYVQRFRYLQTKDRKSRQLCTVAKRVIAKIPTKSIKQEETNDPENDCCAICIEPYKTTDVIRVLPCKHEFHKSCIDPWLLEHRTCPMCKMDILKYFGFVFTGSQESILQLDMDVEDGAESTEPNQADAIIIRAHSVSPTFIIRLDGEHGLRRHSVESTGSAAREFNAYQRYRQQLQGQAESNSTNESAITNTTTSRLPACLAAAAAAIKHHNPAVERYDKDAVLSSENRHRASISLPCTLRKCKNSDTSCHGSNNCYVWALDIQQLSKRGDETSTASAIVNKCRAVTKKRDNDIEFLLLNEHTNEVGESSNSNQNDDYDDYENDVTPAEVVSAAAAAAAASASVEEHESCDDKETDSDSQCQEIKPTESSTDDNSST